MHKIRKITLTYTIIIAASLLFANVAHAAGTLNVDRLTTWYWNSNTPISTTASGDVDGDGQIEVVTGGYYFDGTRNIAQLVVWNGANLACERVTSWYWTSSTSIKSVAIGDVDGDTQVEIITGGTFSDGTRGIAQLCVWDGSSLALENVKTWYWTSGTEINSVAIRDVDSDKQAEVVTGGTYYDGTRTVAQLCVWDGTNLALENVKAWYWTDDTVIHSVAIGNVDNDGEVEVVTGGYYFDGSRFLPQLCIWNGVNLALENVKIWQWTSDTRIYSVAVNDVDDDGQTEVVTAGYSGPGTIFGFIYVWNGANLASENYQRWCFKDDTFVSSVAAKDIDGDGQIEIVTAGHCNDFFRWTAQLCVWNGASLALENVKEWYWTSHTYSTSLAIGDVDADAKTEIVSGGYYSDGTRTIAQLVEWVP